MSKRNDGGPAFPVQDPSTVHAVAYARVQHIEDIEEKDQAYIAARARAVGGLTVRQFYAAAALKGMLSDSSVRPRDGQPIGDWQDEVAAECFSMADAMLRAEAK